MGKEHTLVASGLHLENENLPVLFRDTRNPEISFAVITKTDLTKSVTYLFKCQ